MLSLRKMFFVIMIALGLTVVVVLDPTVRSTLFSLFSPPSVTLLLRHARQQGFWGFLLIFLLMLVHSVSFVPSEVIVIAAVLLYGPLLGIVYTWVGSMAGALLSYGLARFFGRSLVVRFVKPTILEKLQSWLDQKGTVGLLILRLIPFISFNAINYGAGFLAIAFWPFLWTTAIGILPATVLLGLFAANLTNLHAAEWVLSVLGFVVILVVVLRWYVRRKRR